jgi:hypothetical protein
MSGAAGGAAVAGAAAAAVIANAIKASGAIVAVSPEEFRKLLNKAERPLVIGAKAGFMYAKYRYLFNYRGLFFTTLSAETISLPSGAELIWANKIWIPD